MRFVASSSELLRTFAGTNLGRINNFLSDCAAGVQEPSKTPRKRDVEDPTHHRRWYTVPTVIRWQSTKEKRQAAAKRGKKIVAVAADQSALEQTKVDVAGEVGAFDNADDTAAD